MLSSLFSETTTTLTLIQILSCTATSLLLGILVACVHMYNNTYSKNFVVTLLILPVLVQSVILLVNGNLGTGVAIASAFSLVRFRSATGGAREISSIFWSMAIGLATGMGYLGYAAVFSAVTAIILVIVYSTSFGKTKLNKDRRLKITIPENLDYPNLFDDIFKTYTTHVTLDRVKTTNMGSLYELQYTLTLTDNSIEKQMIDELRCRNGNLNIVCGKLSAVTNEL